MNKKRGPFRRKKANGPEAGALSSDLQKRAGDVRALAESATVNGASSTIVAAGTISRAPRLAKARKRLFRKRSATRGHEERQDDFHGKRDRHEIEFSEPHDVVASARKSKV